jgi:2-oxoglutarate ferredoxin oxidoreductase subunit beta
MNDIFKNDVKSAWCPGCSNFGMLAAARKAFSEAGLKPHEVVLVSGIGQAAKFPHYLKCNFFNGLHGRALPVATAIKAVNPKLKVIVTTGDGDCYGEGGNHFLHAIRRNPDITLIVHNNEIYALTKGQASPTTKLGVKTKLQFGGVHQKPFNPLLAALAMGCGFVARGFAGDIEHFSGLIKSALAFKGLSLIDVIQPCITFGEYKTDYYKDKVFKIPDTHALADYDSAIKLLSQTSEKIPTGVFYKNANGENCFGAKTDITDFDLTAIKNNLKELLNEFA